MSYVTDMAHSQACDKVEGQSLWLLCYGIITVVICYIHYNSEPHYLYLHLCLPAILNVDSAITLIINNLVSVHIVLF